MISTMEYRLSLAVVTGNETKIGRNARNEIDVVFYYFLWRVVNSSKKILSNVSFSFLTLPNKVNLVNSIMFLIYFLTIKLFKILYLELLNSFVRYFTKSAVLFVYFVFYNFAFLRWFFLFSYLLTSTFCIPDLLYH